MFGKVQILIHVLDPVPLGCICFCRKLGTGPGDTLLTGSLPPQTHPFLWLARESNSQSANTGKTCPSRDEGFLPAVGNHQAEKAVTVTAPPHQPYIHQTKCSVPDYCLYGPVHVTLCPHPSLPSP